jgi:hypothetical protein
MARISDRDKLQNLFAIDAKDCLPPHDFYFRLVLNHELSYLKKTGFVGEIPFSQVNPIIQRAIIGHWIIKLQISKKNYKHPYGKDAEIGKPLAKVYSVVWDAISAIMDIRKPFPDCYHYECTSHWFSLILFEFALCRSSGHGKKAVLSDLRYHNQILTSIRKGDKRIQWLDKIFAQDKIHTRQLFQALCKNIPSSIADELRDEHLLNIIKAMKAYCTYIYKDVGGVIVPTDEGDRLISGKDKYGKKMSAVFISPESLTASGF